MAAKNALAADLDAAHAKVSQAQRVLNLVKKEVDRWMCSGADSELRHKQVCFGCVCVFTCMCVCV